MLSQVCTITGLEPHIVQNWVKRGFVTAPVDKKYGKRQFCRIALLNALHEALPLPVIVSTLEAAVKNGGTDEYALYLCFNDAAYETENGEYHETAAKTAAARGAASRSETSTLEKVLLVLLTAHQSARAKQKSLLYFARLEL